MPLGERLRDRSRADPPRTHRRPLLRVAGDAGCGGRVGALSRRGPARMRGAGARRSGFRGPVDRGGRRGSARLAAAGASAAPAALAAIAEVAACLAERDLPLLIHSNEPVGHDYAGKGRFTPRPASPLRRLIPTYHRLRPHGRWPLPLRTDARGAAGAGPRRTTTRRPCPTCTVRGLRGGRLVRRVGKIIFGSDFPCCRREDTGRGSSRLDDASRAAVLGTTRKVFQPVQRGADHSRSRRGPRPTAPICAGLLESFVAGDTGLEDVLQRLRLLQVAHLGQFARLDTHRDLRKGVPEVVYAKRKTDAALEAIVRRFLVDRGLALVSRLEPEPSAARRPLPRRDRGGRRTPWLRGPGRAPAGPVIPGLVFAYDPDAGTLRPALPPTDGLRSGAAWVCSPPAPPTSPWPRRPRSSSSTWAAG